MSKMTKAVKKVRVNHEVNENAVTNFMDGISYTLNPIDTLKIVSSSSIFGEPAYYRNGEFEEAKICDGKYELTSFFENNAVLGKEYENKTTSKIMEEVIDKALDYDFEATIQWAKTLRTEYFMRLNPQIIMVRAASHPKREEFTVNNKGVFSEINKVVMSRADEPASQLTYWLYKNKTKNGIPMILKRSWANRIKIMNRYDIYKYRNKGIGIIDTVRVCHANNNFVNELMKTGTIELPVEKTTWETLRAQKMSWTEIIKTIDIPHMALLRNLRGIFTEINDVNVCVEILEKLKAGVANGKQFPFRYYTAYKVIKDSYVNHQQLILDALEDCIDLACENMPKLKGKTMCLSDNSGSAWGTITSEYGSVKIAEIDNLSSVITAKNSTEGIVGKFGDELINFSISKKNGVLAQAKEVNSTNPVGGSTENGVWLFFDKALREKEVWDNIFIYSDQQAGHGELYGINSNEYHEFSYGSVKYVSETYIDVAKLIRKYRKTVNPKVNVFTVQTAGYENVLIPENTYRTSVLYGWTGKELLYAKTINDFWDSKDNEK